MEKKHHKNSKPPGKTIKRGTHINQPKQGDSIRLNRFIAMGGICSRREADNYIAKGRITVNGKVVNEVGSQVNLSDNVCLDGKRIFPEKKIYVLLNKPKDYITTVKDPEKRKTVMDLIRIPGKERIFPVGRLDRATSGVLLLTNDGTLSARLTHPKFKQKKIYHVVLDKPVTRTDLEKLITGIEIDHERTNADEVDYVDEQDKTQVGIEIHSGKYRIVRRMFEHLGYTVKRLDRVYFAGLTKKNLPRGKWRYLSPKEVSMLYRKLPSKKGTPGVK
jgi:23S rRNA pseudouridine2605 synthase